MALLSLVLLVLVAVILSGFTGQFAEFLDKGMECFCYLSNIFSITMASQVSKIFFTSRFSVLTFFKFRWCGDDLDRC